MSSISFSTENRKLYLTAYPRRPLAEPGQAGKPRRKEDKYMAKEKSTKKPISIRYACAPNGDQVGLSHYLMAEAKKK
jgi:modified peptide precursor CbpA